MDANRPKCIWICTISDLQALPKGKRANTNPLEFTHICAYQGLQEHPESYVSILRNYQNPRNFMRVRTLQSTPKGLPQETQRSTKPPESTSFRTFTGHRPNPLETFQKPSDGKRIDLNSRRFLTSKSAKCDVLGPEARFPRELTC